MQVREFQIPVPWGQISVRAWGDERNPPVLLSHGLYDNAAAFDRLVPLLNDSFYYISIDLPGHGKSSYFPPYITVHIISFVFAFKYVVEYLKWEKYILVGHSWSGLVMMVFTQLYPEHTEKLIILDVIYPFPMSVEYFKQFLREREEFLMRLNKRFYNKQKITYERAFEKLQTNRMYGKLSDEAVKVLLSRSLVPAGEGTCSFVQDQRGKMFYSMVFSLEFACDFLERYPISCPLLFLMASDSPPYTLYLRQFVKILQKNNMRCFVRKVEGNHDVHINNPEILAPLVNSFLSYGSSKL